ncbi:hypothetical protein [Ensifer sp. ZNC0028]|uniref:hypothetical protein n=1 Tax=Ensifer sp. ZNC0028 TaxID=1339236 RepID=UPI0005BCDE48|nr:hypothetical protein [Ensifer sp. ZNC0028]
MTPNEIPGFVNELIAAGCEITAIGRGMYVIGEVKAASAEVRRITKKYGERDPLRLEIIAYLWSIGRYIEPETEETGH